MWINILINIIASLVLTFVASLFKENKKPPTAKMEDVGAPEVSEIKAISFGYGTFKKLSPNLIWYGNESNQRITETIDGGWLSGDETITVGFKYFLSQVMTLGHGPINLRKILINDKVVWEDGAVEGTFQGSFADYHFFNEDNGIACGFNFYTGDSFQFYDSHIAYLNDEKGIDLKDFPRFKGYSYIVLGDNRSHNRSHDYDRPIFYPSGQIVIPIVGDESGEGPGTRGMYIGNQFSLSPMSFILERRPHVFGMNPTYKDIGNDYNPAFIVADIIQNEGYGLNIDSSFIDFMSFNEVARKLYEEGLGLSLIYEDKFKCNEFCNEIMRHIGGMMIDTTDGKIAMKLIRDDYDLDEAPRFTENDIVKIVKFERTTNSDLFNEMKIEYTNAEKNHMEGIVQFQNQSLFFDDRTNAEQSTTLSFPFITTAENAAKVAQREIIPLTNNLASITFDVNTDTNNLSQGDIIAITWDKYGISNVAFRIQKITQNTNNGRVVTIDAVQDSFTVNNTLYTPPSDNNKFETPDFLPRPVAAVVGELPEYFSALRPVLYMFCPPNDTSSRYQAHIDTNATSDYENMGYYNFSKLLVISQDIDEFSNSFEVANIMDLGLSNTSEDGQYDGANLLYITDGEYEEWISYRTYTTSDNRQTLHNVKRGLFDTLPRKWVDGNTAFAWTENFGTKDITIGTNDTVRIRPITVNENGNILPEEQASVTEYLTNDDFRYSLPILPKNVKANGISCYSENIDIPFNDLNITLEHRVRQDQRTGQVTSFFENNITDRVLADTDYHITIKDDLDNVLKTDIFNGKSYTWTDEIELDEFEEPINERYLSLNIEIKAIDSDGKEALQSIIFNVTRTII